IGCDGVVVSNHGGRQLDGAAPSLEALPAVVRAVGSKMTVLLDGGVRRGVDILKARALGAQAVLTGRATLFGVIAGGEAGARRAPGGSPGTCGRPPRNRRRLRRRRRRGRPRPPAPWRRPARNTAA